MGVVKDVRRFTLQLLNAFTVALLIVILIDVIFLHAKASYATYLWAFYFLAGIGIADGIVGLFASNVNSAGCCLTIYIGLLVVSIIGNLGFVVAAFVNFQNFTKKFNNQSNLIAMLQVARWLLFVVLCMQVACLVISILVCLLATNDSYKQFEKFQPQTDQLVEMKAERDSNSMYRNSSVQEATREALSKKFGNVPKPQSMSQPQSDGPPSLV